MNNWEEIYKEAARMIAQKEATYSCVAIINPEQKQPYAYLKQAKDTYERVFLKGECNRVPSIPDSWALSHYDDCRHERVMALLFMAQWARTEGIE